MITQRLKLGHDVCPPCLPGFKRDGSIWEWKIEFRYEPLWSTADPVNADFRPPRVTDLRSAKVTIDVYGREFIDDLHQYRKGSRTRAAAFIQADRDYVWYIPTYLLTMSANVSVQDVCRVTLELNSDGPFHGLSYTGWKLDEDPFDQTCLSMMVDDALDRGIDETPYRRALDLVKAYP